MRRPLSRQSLENLNLFMIRARRGGECIGESS
jgi:hypothetical protein